MSALNRWREQSIDDQRVFPMATGFQTSWESLLKRAKIVRFRWHDLRHHFASSLVQCYASTAFERVFKEFGMPNAIRTDNGVPFASPNSLFGLSKLSVWWLRLGIDIERIKPGNPQQNWRHERMHLTLKKEATKPRGAQPPSAAGEVRSLHPGVQPRAAASGDRHALPR
jgi:transposase InsO family protein